MEADVTVDEQDGFDNYGDFDDEDALLKSVFGGGGGGGASESFNDGPTSPHSP